MLTEGVTMFSNDEATLTLYKQALKGIIQDYVIKFHREQYRIEEIITIAFDIIKQLINELQLKSKVVKGRLVALVCYIRKEEDQEVKVYHPSYQCENIDDVETFFTSHMMKIADRIENFNHRGSNLLIKNIAEIHLHITCSNLQP